MVNVISIIILKIMETIDDIERHIKYNTDIDANYEKNRHYIYIIYRYDTVVTVEEIVKNLKLKPKCCILSKFDTDSIQIIYNGKIIKCWFNNLNSQNLIMNIQMDK